MKSKQKKIISIRRSASRNQKRPKATKAAAKQAPVKTLHLKTPLVLQQRMLDLLMQGYSMREVAKICQVHHMTVSRVAHGEEAQNLIKNGRGRLYGLTDHIMDTLEGEIVLHRNSELAWAIAKAIGIVPAEHEKLNVQETVTEGDSVHQLQDPFSRALMEMGERRMLASGTDPSQIAPLFSKAQRKRMEEESRSEPPAQAHTAS